ncbi:hypothetical protein [Alkaliphilus oremlandii]|uniref:Uncharacterized protein n=1 Tax=Alkaliphilus oremlandii (strain OhILAs) TaxID=350688 RepID=A8MKZ3_ALKOO|nr:hypothetical protein [Alkaliphilus oremlandii]ABW17810.1 conserved hypothetical protein [Alkaliphilus oremlandii OhILAs]
MIFLRMGARLLFLRTEKIEELKDFIVENLDGKIEEFERAIDESTEDYTIAFITDTAPEKTDVDDAKYIILIKEASTIILSALLSSHLSGLIHRADLGPACLIMRIAGEEEKVIEKMKKFYGGETTTWRDGIRKGERMDTLVALTTKPIGERVIGEDFGEGILLLSTPVNQVQKRLRADGIVFITQSMEDGQWYELRINIYDSRGNYTAHYRRLMIVLSYLELGLVLGEQWTRDHALMLYSVLAYQIRLFTLMHPRKIKEILVGLEYSENGDRLVDFDLYYRNKKVSWLDVDIHEKKRNKVEEGKLFRKNLFSKLPNTVIEQLLEIETEVKEAK